MLWIIIPTYNEVENIGSLVPAIFKLGLDVKVLIVDDNSPDGTGKVADKLADKFDILVIHRSGKLGLGSAYKIGFDRSLAEGAEYIMEMDADFSHNPEDIPRLLQAAKTGADLAVGSRRVAGGSIIGWGPVRKLMSRGAMEFARFILKLETKDVTAGFRCYRAKFLQSLPRHKIKSNGYAFQEEMIFYVEKLGGRVIEVPVVFNDRQQGKSKLGMLEIIKFFLTIIRLRFSL